jgi:colanic acid biosynthesis glycosyl transferase WcaI
MKICLVSQWYPPEVPALAAPTWAHGLADRNHEVHVVTGVPNYPDGVVYSGYSVRPYAREYDRSVTVHRGFLYPSHDSSALRRMTNYLSFSVGGTFAASQVGDVDAWLTNCTPATAAIPAMVNRTFRGGAHAMVIQDLWPDSVTQSGFVGGRVSDAMNTALGVYCRGMYKHADSIGIISPGMRRVLVDRGVDEDKIQYTPNSVPDSHLFPELSPTDVDRAQLGLPSGMLFMYAGNLGRLQNLDNLIEAFRLVPEAHLVFVGSGLVEAELKKQATGMQNVTFLPRQSIANIGRYIAASDVQILSLQDSPLLKVTMPSKFQASLAAARPILTHAAGDVAELTERESVGHVADPNSFHEAANAIQQLARLSPASLRAMGDRARNLYLTEYSPRVGIDRLETLVNRAISRRQQI